MKPEAQRIAIAEACGWVHHPIEAVGAQAQIFDGRVWFRHPNSNTIACPRDLPDYLSDLNAMHEAELTLTEDFREEYLYQLGIVAKTNTHSDYMKNLWLGTTATASQRAEAFLRTLGLWKD